MIVDTKEILVITPTVLKALVDTFVVANAHTIQQWQCIDKDPLKNLQSLMNLSTKVRANYKSPEFLLRFLKRQISFPGCVESLKLPKTTFYTNIPIIHLSLSKKRYVYKRDLYAFLQNSISEVPLRRSEAEVALSLVVYFMRTREGKVKPAEMVMVPEETVFGEIEKKVYETNKKFVKGGWKELASKNLRFDEMSIQEASELFLEVRNSKDSNDRDVLACLEMFDQEMPMKFNGLAYTKIYIWVQQIVKIFEELIENLPELFLPKPESREATENSKAIVRLFQLDGKKVVMAHEFLYRMKCEGFDVSKFEGIIEPMENYRTLTIHEIFDLVPRDLMKGVEFVCMDPVTISTLVPFLYGGYCLIKFDGDSFTAVNSEEPVEENVEEVIDPLSEEKETPEKPKKMKNLNKKKNRKSAPKIQISKTIEKESAACPKCYRASLYTRKANEKLRLDKIETKALKKKVSQMEKEAEEKDARILALEKLLESQKKGMDALKVEKKQMAENYEKKVAQLEKLIDYQEERIETLEANKVPVILSPTKADENTEKVRDAIFSLMNIQGTIRSEQPIAKVSELTNRLMMTTESEEVRISCRLELSKFRRECGAYMKAVEANLRTIRETQKVDSDRMADLPQFPMLSQGFLNAYKEIIKIDVPKICENLLTTPEIVVPDTECIICLDELMANEEKIQCECCKKQYHGGCIRQWSQTKRTCPTCNRGILDDKDFPKLS
ncbi:unnamed protein product [Caenorhabditis nigoni]